MVGDTNQASRGPVGNFVAHSIKTNIVFNSVVESYIAVVPVMQLMLDKFNVLM